jgi:hypothetical protein
MKFRIPNPLVRRVPVRYWHAEATVKKYYRGSFLDTRLVYFDSVSAEAAAKGLYRIILSQGYKSERFKPVELRVTHFSIPFWRLTYWCPWLTQKYMEKKGFAQNV